MTARKFGRTYVPTERDEQVRLVQWARIRAGQVPELQLLFAVPNGGQRDVRVAARLSGEGVRAGVPDLCLPVPRGVHHGLYIELKRIKGGKVSPAQAWWHQQLRTQGYRVIVALGWEAAREEIEAYLALGAA